jgi:hypothetical protein
MLIKLTNAAENHKDDAIYINPDHITCIFSQAKIPGGSMTSFVHCHNGSSITWEVEESSEEIMKLIGAKNAKCRNCSCNTSD